MIYPEYNGRSLIPSNAAIREMAQLGVTLDECKFMLEHGYLAPRKRAKGTEEKWIDRGRKTYNIVVVKSFQYSSQKEVYLITHVGRFTKK